MNTQQSLIALQRQIHREAHSCPWPLPNIMPWLLDRRNLDAAWQRVRSADGAKTPGIDGITVDDVGPGVERWLRQLSADLSRDKYQPQPPRYLDVPKSSGSRETRRLGILVIRDRLVHAGLKQVLEPILETMFLDGSFGFRPGRSVAAALATAASKLSGTRARPAPFGYAAKMDVANCFDTIDHGLLLARLEEVVGDEQSMQLISRLLQVGYCADRGWWRRRKTGLVQGSGLSPLLCNFYLHALDRQLDQLRRETEEGIIWFRYADDLLVLARNARLARAAVRRTRQTLRRLRQRLKTSKSQAQPVTEPFEWLGVRIQRRQSGWADRTEFGYAVPDAKVGKMLARIEEITEPPSTRIDPSVFDIGRWIVSVNTQLKDWWQAYLYADNATEVFRALDAQAFQRVGQLLFHITGVRGPKLYGRYCVRLARGFETWEINGTRLAVLSALAPRRACRLIRKPAWTYRHRTSFRRTRASQAVG